jgi:PAS domain S-box-containing protein
MKSKDKKTPEVPAAESFYSLSQFSSKPSPPAGEPHSNVSLRQKAEAHFRERESQSSEKIDTLSPESMRTILHELRVHQIELEMQNEELRAAQAELDVSRARYFDLYDLAPVGYITVSEPGLILESNITAAILLGVDRGKLVKQPFSRLILKEDQDIYYKHRQQLIETGDPQKCELRLVKADGSTFWAQLSATAAQSPDGEPACRVVLSDITDRKQAQAYREIDGEVIQIFLHSEDLQDSIQRTLATLKARTGFDAVGIRLQDGEDFPYFVQDGFPEGFLLKENSLLSRTADGGICRNQEGNVCLECTCGLVISGQTDPANPLFTRGGSCWTNDSFTLLGIPSDQDPRHHPRNQCIHHGFASVALIPIRIQERITGLIQLNDRRKGRFTLERVEILEGIAGHIGEALMRKQAEEELRKSEAEFRTLAEAMPQIVWATRADGWNIYFNHQWVDYTGLTLEESYGHGWNKPFHPDDQQRAWDAWQRATKYNDSYSLECRLRRADGTYRWWLIRGIPLLDANGMILKWFGTCTDIEDIRQAAEKLKETTARAKEFAIKAEAAAAAKSEFLSVMSHELRTPLNAVLGFSELLADTPLNDEQKSFVKTVSSSGEHLLAVVNDILDFSSIEHGALAIQSAPLSIGELVESSDVAIRQAAAEKGIDFRCEVAAGVPEKITADARRIRQILINLLGNALKFTSSGSVVLCVAPAADGRFLDFSVEDTGIGISPETLPRLFSPFTQANSTTSRRFGGTGLGLAISKRLAEAMGGTLTVTSIPGKGSTFTFRLPLEIQVPACAPAASAPCNPDSTPPSSALVFVVEDDQNSSVLAGKLLQSLGYIADFAADGAEALKAFAPGKFSAILMDVSMPVMGGLEATKKIREIEEPTGSHVPIIALTANVMPGDRERCLAAGMDDFLSKPFKRAELAAVLARATQIS